jgi:O-antigen/teichoic acid export membrane protein
VNILKVFGSVFSINILDYVLSFLSTILITKNLSVADYGTYSFLGSVASLVFTFFTLGLAQYNSKIIPGRDIKTRYEILGNSLFFEFFASVLGIIVISFIMYKKINKNTVYLVFIIRLLFGIFNNEFLRYFGYEKKIIQKTIIGFIDGKLWVFLFVIYLLFDNVVNINAIFSIQCINSIITLFLCFFLLSPKFFFKNFKYNYAFLKSHIKYSVPFVFVDLGMYMLEMSVRYILTFSGSMLSLGLFSFAYNWTIIIFRFSMLFIYILQPYISNAYYSSSLDKAYFIKFYQFQKIAIKYSIYILLFALAYFIIFFDTLILLIGKSDYLQTRTAVILLAPLSIFMCISYFIQIIILLAGKSYKIPLCYFFMAGINILFNIIFIPKYGYNAAAVINSVSYFFLMIMLIFISPKIIKLKFVFKEYVEFVLEFIFFIFLMIFVNHIDVLSGALKLGISGFIVALFLLFIYAKNKNDFLFLNAE